jgi:hypothetical protein
MPKSSSSWMWLCLGALVLGIFIGGGIEAAAHHKNNIHLKVMPWGEVNISPEIGDTIDWTPFDAKPLTVQFSGQQPCHLTNDNLCTIESTIGPGVYLYQCVGSAGSAKCPDPGVGPASTTNPTGGRIFGKLLEMFDGFMSGIDRFLGFAQTQIHSGDEARVETSGGTSASMSAFTKETPAVSRQVPAQVSCDNQNHITLAPPVSGKLGGDPIYWTSDQPFSLAMSASICKENTSTPGIVQQCTLTNATPGGPYTYTATQTSCSAQPSAAQNVTVQ